MSWITASSNEHVLVVCLIPPPATNSSSSYPFPSLSGSLSPSNLSQLLISSITLMYMCGCLWQYVYSICAWYPQKWQESTGLLETRVLWATWYIQVLGSKFESSPRIANVLTHWAVSLAQWFPPFLMLQPFNTDPYSAVTPTIKWFYLLFHNCDFAIRIIM